MGEDTHIPVDRRMSLLCIEFRQVMQTKREGQQSYQMHIDSEITVVVHNIIDPTHPLWVVTLKVCMHVVIQWTYMEAMSGLGWHLHTAVKQAGTCASVATAVCWCRGPSVLLPCM